MPQDQVLPQLYPDNAGIRVLEEGGHACAARCGGKVRGVGSITRDAEYNRGFLTMVKDKNPETSYIYQFFNTLASC